MYGLQEHEMRFYFSLLATSDFFCRHAYAYAHMRIIRHESDMAAYAWPSLVKTNARDTLAPKPRVSFRPKFYLIKEEYILRRSLMGHSGL